MLKWIKTFWFLLVLMGVIGAAYLAPDGSAGLGAMAEVLKTVSIVGLFLVSGLTLPTQVLRASIGHWRLHGFVQVFNLALIPLLSIGLRCLLLWSGMDAVLADGFIILACVPTTIASCVAMTAIAGGNEAGAICNSTLGNLLGVVVSPLLVYLLLSLRGSLEWIPVIRGLTLLVVLPTLIGQVVRIPFKTAIVTHQRRLTTLSQVLLLTVIYLVFAATFSRETNLPAGSLPQVIAVVFCGHIILLDLNWRLSKWSIWRLDRADRIAALMCGTQKTVALGIPLITVLYDQSPLVGLISVPLLCYHPIQLVIGTLAALRIGRDRRLDNPMRMRHDEN